MKYRVHYAEGANIRYRFDTVLSTTAKPLEAWSEAYGGRGGTPRIGRGEHRPVGRDLSRGVERAHHRGGARKLHRVAASPGAGRCAFRRVPSGAVRAQGSLKTARRISSRRSFVKVPCQRERASFRSWRVRATRSAVTRSGKSELPVVSDNQGPPRSSSSSDLACSASRSGPG